MTQRISEGGYLTRGRAAELEQLLAESEARLNRRMDELARDVSEARGEARQAMRLVLDIARRSLGAALEVYRDAVSDYRRAEPPAAPAGEEEPE